MVILSIVIPIYNVEKYLKRCLDSIFRQAISEDKFELIAVIDGSPDNCLEIVKDYSKIHKNIIIINKANGGVSSARNAGLEVCKGQYVTFVDPDDYIQVNSLNLILDKLRNNSSEIIVCNSTSDKDDSVLFDWRPVCKANANYTRDTLFCLYNRGSVWGVLYSKSFLNKNKLRFVEGIRNTEDVIFITQCLSVSQSVVFWDINFYILYRRDDSATRRIDIGRLYSMKRALDYAQSLRGKTTDVNEDQYYEQLMYRIISFTTSMSCFVPDCTLRTMLDTMQINNYLPIRKYKNSSSKLSILNISYVLYYWLMHIKYIMRKPNYI